MFLWRFKKKKIGTANFLRFIKITESMQFCLDFKGNVPYILVPTFKRMNIEYSQMSKKNIGQSPHNYSHSQDWSVHQRSLQTQKNFNLLLKRINVLTQQRSCKLRSLQTTLQRHYQFITQKLERSRQAQLLKERASEYNTARELSVTQSKINREAHRLNLSRIRETLQLVRTEEGRAIRREIQQKENQRREHESTRQQTNARKRNFIRLGELETREKVSRFWENRLRALKGEKEWQTQRAIEGLNMSLTKIGKLEKSEASLIKDLLKTDTIKADLQNLMSQQKTLEPDLLATKYHLKSEPAQPSPRLTDKFKRISVVPID